MSIVWDIAINENSYKLWDFNIFSFSLIWDRNLGPILADHHQNLSGCVGDKSFAKPLKSLFLGHFRDFLNLSRTHLNFFFKKTGTYHFSYFMSKFMEKKSEKKLMIWRSCITDGWKDEQSQIYSAMLLGKNSPISFCTT